MSSATDCSDLARLRWLLGGWRAEAGERVIRERWAAVALETWEGTGETRAATDGALLASESLRLVAMGGEVFYLAKVGHNPRPVAFRLSECSDQHAVFENPDHDFPRRLDYRLDGKELHVRVSDGAEQGFSLHFLRSARD